MSELDLILFILKQICFGSLISGFIIFFLTMFIQGSNLFDHDYDVDHDIDHEVGGVESGVTIGMDKDISIGVDEHLDLSDHHIDVDSPAPFMLLLGTFMITFGGTGTVLLNNQTVDPIISITITIIFPVLVTFAVSKLWTRIAVDETYQTALETINIDDEVKTLTTVDTQGGLVVIETSSIHGPVKMAAKTRFGAVPRNMPAYVVEIKGITLIIDEWRTSNGKEKPIPEGKITWE